MDLEKKTSNYSNQSKATRLPKPEKKWSKQKRIRVAVKYTLIILGIGLIIGYGLYVMLVSADIIKPLNLKSTLKQEMMNNPKVIRGIHNKLSERICTNSFYRISLTYKAPLTLTQENGKDACLQFISKSPNGRDARTIISRRSAPANIVIADITSSLTTVITNNFLHAKYSGTEITGIRNNQDFYAVILSLSPEETLIIEHFPSDQISQQHVVNLINSIQIE